MSLADEKPFGSAEDDDRELRALGYKPSFKREFTNLATVSYYLFIFEDMDIDELFFFLLD